MGLFKPIETTKGNIGNIKEVAGQMISCSDTGELYFDTIKNGRQSIADLIIVENDEARTSLTKPLSNKLYLVKDTNYIWRYDSSAWNQLTFSKPSIKTYYHSDIDIPKVFNNNYITIDYLNENIVYNDFDINTDYLEIFINGILINAGLNIYIFNNLEEIRLHFGIDCSKYTSESDILVKVYKNCGPMVISQPSQ